MQSREDTLRQKASQARRLMAATDDAPTLRELKSFAQDCDREADRLRARSTAPASGGAGTGPVN